MMIETVNPATGETLDRHAYSTETEVESALERAVQARSDWCRRSPGERADVLSRIARVLERRRDEDALLITREMGKPLDQSAGEIDKSIWVCDHYVERGPSLLQPETVLDAPGDPLVQVRPDPLGTILAIMPWNLPFWQVFRFAAPNLVAGNTIVLKHALNVSGSAMAIRDIMEEAQVPPGVFEVLFLPDPGTEGLIADPRISAVTLTGSVRAGRAVAAAAGKVVKRVGLELGGSDPFIVLDDADLDLAARVGAKARLFVGGQSCIAAKRFVVQRSIASEFRDRLVEEMSTYIVGDPEDAGTNIGPLARRDILEGLSAQVAATRAAGATAVLGGERLDGPGFYYPPTLLTDVAPDSAAAIEELFGPAAALLIGDDERELVELANASPYGLGCSIFSEDRERAVAMAPEIDVGNVFVNGMVRSDPRVPFGGVKDSGYGRELGDLGIHEFVNMKSVWVE